MLIRVMLSRVGVVKFRDGAADRGIVNSDSSEISNAPKPKIL